MSDQITDKRKIKTSIQRQNISNQDEVINNMTYKLLEGVAFYTKLTN